MTKTIRFYRRQIMNQCRHNAIAWRYLLNARPALAYATHRRPLAAAAARVLARLDRDGVALTSTDALGMNPSLFAELAGAVDGLERSKAAELDDARRFADDASLIGNKTFNIELLGGAPVFDADDICCRIALDRSILDVANAYFGMFTRLRYFNVWHTLATHVAPRESQLWHRDREDFHILKVFIYLADVDRDAGPFTYAPGTHPKGAVAREPAYSMEGQVRRSTDAQMAEVVAAETWIEALGPRGTVVFADTRGYHKGGLARGRDRLMYTCMFTSQASESRDLFTRSRPVPVVPDHATAFALR